MNNSTKHQTQILLSQLDNFVDKLQDYIESVHLDVQDPTVLEDVALVRSYADQLRQAVRADTAREALPACNKAQSINKGIDDRVWTEGQPWIQEQGFEIMRQALKVHGLLVEELGGFDKAYPA